MKHQIFFTIMMMILLNKINAQNVAINETGSSAHPSAMLHVQSTDKGLLIPRMTTMQRNAIVSPAPGLMVFDTQTGSFWFRGGAGQWVELRDATDDRFIDGTFGMYTTETGIGVGAAPASALAKFYGIDSINNTVHLGLRNKHTSGNAAFYLLDNAGAISGTFEYDNADKQLYIQNGQPSTGGDIIFRTNQFFEIGSSAVEVMRIKRLGGIGIGTNNPGAKLHISNAASTMGLRVDNTMNSASDIYGILNDINADGIGNKFGIYNRVFGKATSDAIYSSFNYALSMGHPMDAYAGYFIVDTAGTGAHYGIYTLAEGDGDYALYSQSNNPDGYSAYLVGRTYISGRLGIGIDTPEYKVHVVSAGRRGMNLETEFSSSASDSVYGIYNIIHPEGLGVHYGMYSRVELDPSNTSDIYGVRAQVEPEGTGTHWAVYGRANGDNNIGVEGLSSAAGIGVKGTNTNDNGWAGYFDGNAYIEDRLEVRNKILLRPAGHASGGEIELFDNDGDETFRIRAGEADDNGAEMHMFNDGNDLTIELDAEGAGNGGAIILSDEEGDETVYIRAAQNNTNGAEILLHNDVGELTVELDADFNAGKGRVITDELEITGGADLAEHFDIVTKNTLQPGMLVSIDPDGSGRLVPACKAYDSKVAGVISGAQGISPGMLMGQRSSVADGDFPVALVGRVYVLADASKHAIKPGDLMTSSDRAGYAMSVRKHKQAQGAVIGKALTGLNEGTGYVLILVNLQ